MHLRKRILASADVKLRRGRLVVGNHLLAAARIAGQRKGAELLVRRDESAADERFDKGDESARMTAGVRDALRRGDAFAAALQLGKPVLPRIVDTVGRRRVDDDCGRILNEADGVQGCGVGQAEKRDVRLVKRLTPRLDVFAQVFGKDDELKVLARRQALADAKASGASRTVYEYALQGRH